MSENTKYEFQDFTQASVVSNHKDTGTPFELKDFKNPVAAKPQPVADVQATEATTENSSEAAPQPQPVEDLYAKGYEEAKKQFEPLVQETEDKNTLTNLLQEKLDTIIPLGDLQEQIFRLSTKLISAIGHKMYLVWPIDFEKMMMNEIAEMLKKYYKSGSIVFSVHPSRIENCSDILKIASLPPRLAENIRIVGEETIEKNNCRVEWQDSRLEYNQEQIMLEADRILEHLKMTY